MSDRSNDYFWGLVFLIVALIILAFSGWPAFSHSWYDPDCCSNQDCEPVTDVKFIDPVSVGGLPIMVVTTSLGTKPLTEKTKVRQSKDSRMHACIYQGALLCIYMPPGN